MTRLTGSGSTSSDSIMGRNRYPEYLWTAYRLYPVREYRFHPTRKWRFDYCFPSVMAAVEIEGGIWIKGTSGRGGAHSLPSNIIRDMEKQNAAGLLGWRVFRFTPEQLRSGKAQSFMLKVLGRTL